MKCEDLIPGKFYFHLNSPKQLYMFLEKENGYGYGYWFLLSGRKNKTLFGPMAIISMRFCED